MKKILAFVLSTVSAVFTVSASGKNETAAPDYRNPAALEKLIQEKSEGYILLDVRTPEEYADGYIPTAINLPYDEIGSNTVPAQDRNTLIVVYCRTGRRSAIARETLGKLGYTNVVDFGGISRWRGKLE